MSEVVQKVQLIRHTLSPEEMVALGAKLCYSGAHLADLQAKVEAKDQTAFVNRIMEMGHDSVLEPTSFTFAVEGVSRVLLAQITRHRLASFSVQSQRYVSYGAGFGYVIPPKIRALGDEAVEKYCSQMDTMAEWYREWQEKLGNIGEGANEDARFVLPGACETRFLVTMNARELRHFFSLRMCNRAQWEIRSLATKMHAEVMQVAPALFADAGPGCLRGGCPERAKTCGKADQIRKERQKMLSSLQKPTETP